MQQIIQRVSQGQYPLSLTLYQLGGDYLVTLEGGEAHLGAIAWNQESTVLKPHKEGPIALEIAAQLEPLLSGQVAVIAGIHYPNLSAQGIQEILQTVAQLTEQLKKDSRFPRKNTPAQTAE